MSAYPDLDWGEYERTQAADTDRPDVDHEDRATGRRVDDRALLADLVAAQREAGLA